MARPISRIVDDLLDNVRELKDAIGPIARLAAAFRGGEVPSPARTVGKKPGRKPGRPRKTEAVDAADAVDTADTGDSGPAAGAAAPQARPAPRKAGKKNPSNQLQGSYMAAVRSLSKADKAEVKKVRSEKGVEEAIKLAQSKKG